MTSPVSVTSEGTALSAANIAPDAMQNNVPSASAATNLLMESFLLFNFLTAYPSTPHRARPVTRGTPPPGEAGPPDPVRFCGGRTLCYVAPANGAGRSA